jgi:hypothetical protein
MCELGAINAQLVASNRVLKPPWVYSRISQLHFLHAEAAFLHLNTLDSPIWAPSVTYLSVKLSAVFLAAPEQNEFVLYSC